MSRYAGMYVENAATTKRADGRVEFELPVLRYPLPIEFELPVLRYPLPTPWHREGGEQYAAGFWLPYIASEEDARQHFADFDRTRIKPGADPRSKWSGSLMKTDPTIYRDEPHTPKWCEVGPSDRPDLAWINGPWNALGWRLSSRARYVPLDVCRWRDPEHREALKRRARAHAALVPGNRATMGVER